MWDCVSEIQGRARKWERGGKERAVRKFPFPDPGDGTCVGRVSV